MGFIRLLFVATVAAVSLATAGCAAEDPAASAASAASGRGGGRGGAGGAVPVTVAPVVTKAMPIEITVIGTAEAFSNVGIRSQITGQLEKVNFTEGDDVQQGQVLFTLDRRPLELALREAQANLERDTAQAENAALMTKRYEDLAKRGIAPREQLDTSRADMAALNATVSADQRRARERERAVGLRHDQGADLRSYRRADGARGQPRARQRSDRARRHQPDHADVGVVLSAGITSSRIEALPRWRRAQRRRRHRLTMRVPPPLARSPSSTTRLTRTPARSASRARSPTRIAGSGLASSSTW